ncbi:hypothetical protein GCM10022419_117240 [Nonomuraea rosea]|uniref:Nudix hydrolase domain-containing protein n=1 Tax=Nonomuraea rosea TaxID=638574 RepID=A0ABP6ZKH8_9ACTN
MRVAAARELSEEPGAGVPVRFMVTFLCREGVSPVWSGVHEAMITEPELREVVDRWPFVPGGQEALRRYLAFGNEGGPSAVAAGFASEAAVVSKPVLTAPRRAGRPTVGAFRSGGSRQGSLRSSSVG